MGIYVVECVCELRANRDSVALVCSLFLSSSLYTDGGREREGESCFRTQCSALPCQPALCTAANPTMPPWIFYSPSQELKNTRRPIATRRTHIDAFGGRTNAHPLRYSGHKEEPPPTQINRNKHTCGLAIPRRVQRIGKGQIAEYSLRFQMPPCLWLWHSQSLS